MTDEHGHTADGDAADAHDVRRIADGIVDGQARYRRRARWAGVFGLATMAAVVAPIAVVLSHGTRTGGAGGAGGTVAYGAAPRSVAGDGSVANLAVHGRPVVSPSDAARVYARTLRDFRSRGELVVWRTVCDVHGVCSAGGATRELRADLALLLGPRLTWSSRRTGAIALQSVRVHADRARASIQLDCGRMCVEGEQARLRRSGTPARWHVTQAAHYIS